MDVATVMGIVQSLLTAIQCSDQLKKMCSHFRYKSDLQSLQRSLNTISAVLEDADAKQGALTRQDKLYLEELRDVVYEADDVLDEFFTLIRRKKISQDGGNGNLFDKVTSFFTRFKPLAINMSKKVENVRKKLDAIAANRSQFRIDVDDQPLRFRKEETCSYVYADDIIGRQADVDNVLDMLLSESTVERDVSCLAVVGMGGLGKTALAQLVFNHERVKSAFPLRLWTCVSDDENHNHLDTEATLRKILAATTGIKDDKSTLESVQSQLREILEERKYLLVLDDVWSENYGDWMKLMGYLKACQKGSWILVTTRSEQTAYVVGNGPPYMLRGLSQEDSWQLFRRAAFGTEQPDPSCDDLVSVGRKIVKKCANVPLAIRAIGSLLYGQPKSKWLSIQEKGLANIEEDEHGIKPILKLSYHHLKYPLKSCFRYCSLFPKDEMFGKANLISLWKAQGYIVPERGEDVQDVAEHYFSILLRRCFFQDVEKDEYGEIVSCKMHDLMYDIAQDTSKDEICLASGHTIEVDEKVRHFSLVEAEFVKFSSCQNNIRSCILDSLGNLSLDELVEKCTRLRTLDLSHMPLKKADSSCVGIASLPDSIGSLLHLRYLNLSWNQDLEVLPKSMTKLHNLQNLNLRNCINLRELPNKMGKLLNLSILDVTGCDGLTYMPAGLGKMTNLHTLGRFVVCGDNRSAKQCFGELEDLKPLKYLKGCLDIVICVPEDEKHVKKDDNRGGTHLRNKERLYDVTLSFRGGKDRRSSDYEEGVLEQLQPHSNLKKLFLGGYYGVRMPRWLREDNFSVSLPNLVELKIEGCGELRWLPSLGRLPHLKYLRLDRLLKLEYVELDSWEEDSSYFPCLTTLHLKIMPKFKGWWTRSGSKLVQNDQVIDADSDHLARASYPCLPQVKQLHILYCPKMACIPWCPLVEHLLVENYSVVLQVLKDPSSSALHSEAYPKLMVLHVCNVELLKLIPVEYLQCFSTMTMKSEEIVKSLAEVKGLFYSSALSSLRSLEITYCSSLKSICGWVEHLPALEKLRIGDCPDLVRNGEMGEGDGIPWRKLPPTLHTLRWEHMGNLPDGMQYCTSLQFLEIWNCTDIESLPSWMPKLASLTHLQLRYCSTRLKERCNKDTGEDWPLIQHISHIFIRDEVKEATHTLSHDDKWVKEEEKKWQR